MLLVIDVGNTNMKLGVYDGDVLKKAGVFQPRQSAPQTNSE